MTSPSLSALLHLHGLPPLPRSLTGYSPQNQAPMNFSSSIPPPAPLHRNDLSLSSSGLKGVQSQSGYLHQPGGKPSPPVPPPRPHSRRSSSSGSSFRASPEHVSNPNRSMMPGVTEGMRSAPRSLSSSPHSPHIDSGIGRSSADSFSEPRAFVRVVKSPPIVGTRLDAQLSQLKKDMNHLRQQDMALLGHLLQIHQGIQDLKNVLVPPPQPAPMSGPLPMFHSTPTSYHPSSGSTSSSSRHSRNSKGHQQSSQSSRLSILSSGAKLFSRRSSADKLMAEAMNQSLEYGACGGGIMSGHGHGHHSGLIRRRDDDESDSLSSLEFGDV